MKDFITNLYSHDYETKAETDEDDDAEINFMIANEGLDGAKEKSTMKWLSLKSKGNSQRFVNHQNQIVRTVKWLNQQLRGSPQRVRYSVNGRLRFETVLFLLYLVIKILQLVHEKSSFPAVF